MFPSPPDRGYRSLRLAVLALSSAMASVHCGNGVSSTAERPSTLATIEGQVVNPAGIALASGGAFRVAIVWSVPSTQDGGARRLRVAQDVPVNPVFPASFSLALSEPPPDDAMFSPNPTVPTFRVAEGALIAYQDKNGNGALDLVDPTAPSAIDAVLATDRDLTMVYIEGTPSGATFAGVADSNGRTPVTGFNFYDIVHCSNQPCDDGFQWESVATPVNLAVSNSPSLSSLMCSAEAGSSTSTSVASPVVGTFPATFPSPGDPNLICSNGGRTYSLRSCQENATSVCAETSSSCQVVSYQLAIGQAAPAGWPCTTP